MRPWRRSPLPRDIGLAAWLSAPRETPGRGAPPARTRLPGSGPPAYATHPNPAQPLRKTGVARVPAQRSYMSHHGRENVMIPWHCQGARVSHAGACARECSAPGPPRSNKIKFGLTRQIPYRTLVPWQIVETIKKSLPGYTNVAPWQPWQLGSVPWQIGVIASRSGRSMRGHGASEVIGSPVGETAATEGAQGALGRLLPSGAPCPLSGWRRRVLGASERGAELTRSVTRAAPNPTPQGQGNCSGR